MKGRKKKSITKKPKETLCWGCKRSCGLCPWSMSLTPVKGWTARKTALKGGKNQTDKPSYFVLECPLFEGDNRE